MFSKQDHTDEVLHGIFEQSVNVDDSSVNRLGGNLMNSFRIGLEKAYFESTADFSVGLPHISDVVLPAYPGEQIAGVKL